jgi:hypothetical protein
LSKEASFHKPLYKPSTLLRRYFVFDSALHFGMTVPYVPSASNIRLLETHKEYLRTWKEANPDRLCKIGGKQESLERHHNADQYNPMYFDRDNAIVFPGTFTESRLAAWLELMLIQFAFALDIGVNKKPRLALQYGLPPR